MQELITKLNDICIESQQLINEIKIKLLKTVIPKINVRYSKKLNKEKSYIYDQQKYNKQYYQKNKDKYKVKHICNVCNGSYTLATKSYHFKSKKHMRSIEYNNSISENNNSHQNSSETIEIKHRTSLDDILN